MGMEVWVSGEGRVDGFEVTVEKTIYDTRA